MAVRTLAELFNHYASDKSSVHSYGDAYAGLFPDPTKVRAVLEMGVRHGGSAYAWRDHFPQAKIVGFDREDWLVGQDRIWTIKGDQDAPAEFIDTLRRSKLLFDLIVDDCSHLPHHQIAFSVVLRQFLAPGGVYVIEDVASDEYVKAMTTLVPEFEVVDLRSVKGRYDDVLLIWRKPA